jgi:hypothetical protein
MRRYQQARLKRNRRDIVATTWRGIVVVPEGRLPKRCLKVNRHDFFVIGEAAGLRLSRHQQQRIEGSE